MASSEDGLKIAQLNLSKSFKQFMMKEDELVLAITEDGSNLTVYVEQSHGPG